MENNGWNHCKDLMPRLNGRYLVARADRSVEIATLYLGGPITRTADEWFMDRDSDVQVTDVTHWAPLPNYPEAA